MVSWSTTWSICSRSNSHWSNNHSVPLIERKVSSWLNPLFLVRRDGWNYSVTVFQTTPLLTYLACKLFISPYSCLYQGLYFGDFCSFFFYYHLLLSSLWVCIWFVFCTCFVFKLQVKIVFSVLCKWRLCIGPYGSLVSTLHFLYTHTSCIFIHTHTHTHTHIYV